MNSSNAGEIDLSIKTQKKIYNNKNKKKYVNLVGDKFDYPEACKKSHNKERYNCMSLSLDDVLTFRNRLYATEDKITQDRFISNYVHGREPKRRRRSLNGKSGALHDVEVSYSMENREGKKFNICKNMFVEVTNFGKKRVVEIAKQIKIHGMIKENRGGDRRSSTFVEKRIIKLVQQTEQQFFQENPSSTDHEFVDIKVEEDYNYIDMPEEEEELVVKKSPRKPKKKEETTSRKSLVEPKSEKLESIESLCRICLNVESEKEKNVFLYEQFSSMQTNAELLEFCLGIKLTQNDGFPQKLCTECLVRAEMTHKLKTDSLKTSKYLEDYLAAQKFKEEPVDDFLETEDTSKNLMEFNDFDNLFADEEEEKSLSFKEDSDFEMECPVKSQETEGNPSKNPARCYLCDADFQTPPKLHFEISHNQTGTFNCKFEKCEFSIDSLWYLNLHYQIHNDDIRLCSYCGKSFPPASFFNHRGHCGSEKDSDKVFKCSHCDRVFFKKHKLKEHSRMHTGEKPYVCSICGVAYAKHPSLRKHMLTHGATPDFTCYCGKGFVQKYRLKAHQESCLKNRNVQ